MKTYDEKLEKYYICCFDRDPHSAFNEAMTCVIKPV